MKLVLCALLAGCGVAQATTAPPHTTPALRPPEGNAVLLKAHARGVQIYTCKQNGAKYEWALRAPEAELFDERGGKLGSHFAGPTWKAQDGSQIVGELRERQPSPTKDAVPWLLLSAKKSEGHGVLGEVRWIQRVDTEGGLAPAVGCDSEHVGQDARAPYQANYYFWSAAR
jgi:hypothetical protein